MNRISRNQIILFITLSCLAVIILITSFIRQSQAEVYAQLGASQPTPSLSVVQTMLREVPVHSSYKLPAPGILPINPFYPVKMIRDRIGLAFTQNPNRRAGLLLLYADKRIAAAHALIERGAVNAAVTTAVKAEAYLSQAISITPEMDQEKRNQWLDALKLATLKHEEIIEEMQLLADGPLKNQADDLYQDLNRYREQIVSLSGVPFGYVRPDDQPETTPPSAAPISNPFEPHM